MVPVWLTVSDIEIDALDKSALLPCAMLPLETMRQHPGIQADAPMMAVLTICHIEVKRMDIISRL